MWCRGLRREREGDCAQENSENDRNLAELVSEDVNDDFGTRKLIKQFVELENPSFSCMKSKCTQSRKVCETIFLLWNMMIITVIGRGRTNGQFGTV